MKIRKEIIIGLVAIISVAVFIWGYKFLQGQNFLSNDQNFYAIYPTIDQLQTSSAVLINGYEVGSVTGIKLLPEDNNKLRVEFTVKGEIAIPPGTEANIVSQSIMGGKVIQLKLNGFCSGDCLASGSQLQGKSKGIVESMLSVDDMKEYFSTANKSVSSFIDTLDASLKESASKDGVGTTVDDVKVSLEHIKQTTETLNEMMDATAKTLPSLISNLNAITRNIKGQNENINASIENINSITKQLSESNINGTVDKAGTMMESANTTIASLDKSIKQLNSIISDINSSKGSLGKLVNDDELYKNLEKSTESLDRLLMDIKARPSRYVRFSVFGGDKSEPTFEEQKVEEQK